MRRFLEDFLENVQPGAYLVLVAAILTIPMRWVFAWVMASFVHELGHYSILRLCGKRIYGFKANWNGMILETEELGKHQWLCALGGPLFGLFLIPFSRWFPRLTVCALVQSGINLLPIYPADGGRVLYGLLSLWLSTRTAHRITTVASAIVLTGLTGVFLHFMNHDTMNMILPVFLVVLVAKFARTITSCKAERLLVQ